MNYAGFFTRFFALLIDEIAMGVLAFFVSLILGACAGLAAAAQSDFVSVLVGAVALITLGALFIFQFLYFGYFWSKSGQSVGMKLLNIRVVRQTGGEDLSFWRAGFRGTLGYAISGLVFGLGFIWAAFDGNQETWHDKIFDTWVVES
ncbi:MAG: RDD family protein [Anaerolineales bacterium]|jgi:uncharacterized RDD family membrane protein YckC